MGNFPSYSNPFSMQQLYGQQSFPMMQPQMSSVQPQQLQQSQLLGRYVASADEITPQEVSMGNAPSLFPLADGSAIIAKQWANDGTIKTVRYSAELADDSNEAASVSLMDVMNQLDNMQDAINALQKSLDKKPATTTKRTTAKKEADTDDEA